MWRPPLLYILLLPKLKLLQMFHLFCIFSNAPKYGRQVHHQAVLRVLLNNYQLPGYQPGYETGLLDPTGEEGPGSYISILASKTPGQLTLVSIRGPTTLVKNVVVICSPVT